MRIALGLFSLLVFGSPFAAAQDLVAWERFFPGEVGDYWEFRDVHRVCSPTCIVYHDITTVWTVVSYEEASGTLMMEVEMESPDVDPASCRITISEGDDWFTVEQLTGTVCLPLISPFGTPTFTMDEPLNPSVVTVGGFEHEIEAVKSYGGEFERLHRFAANLGLYENYSRFQLPDYLEDWRRTVQRAHVEGVDYGVPVDVEPSSPMASEGLALYPNPFSDRLTVHVATATARAVTVEVVDVMGRRVLVREAATMGPSELGVADLTPGIYLVRIVGAEGTALVRRVTKVR